MLLHHRGCQNDKIRNIIIAQKELVKRFKKFHSFFLFSFFFFSFYPSFYTCQLFERFIVIYIIEELN